MRMRVKALDLAHIRKCIASLVSLQHRYAKLLVVKDIFLFEYPSRCTSSIQNCQISSTLSYLGMQLDVTKVLNI